MEFNENNNKPKSKKTILQLQVEEQSDVCDITVKIGLWERKYHRCVLMASPFFECVLKHDFLEKHTGVINLNCGTPTNTDMALMYLYGKIPKLDDSNIEVMIELAEFFQIPNLKSACVNWLRRQTISDDNCLSMLQLSSVYRFELPACTEYLESHLNEVLLQASSNTLTFESIDYIFTEEKFCFFQMEDRLRFLMRWYIAQPDKREECTKKLLEFIAFEDISPSCLNEIKSDKEVENIMRDVQVGHKDPNELTDVLICKKRGSLLCFDLSRDTWFKIQLDSTNDTLHFGNIEYTVPDDSGLYIKNASYDGCKLLNYNLATGKTKSNHVVSNTGANIKRPETFCFKSNICVTCIPDHVETKQSIFTGSTSLDIVRLMPFFEQLPEPDRLEFLSNCYRTTYKNATLVLIGQLTGEQVRMDPVFSVADAFISTVTVNADSVVAFIIPDKRTSLIMYDTVGFTMDKLDIKTEYKDEIFPAKNGFVIHNNKRCIRIMRLAGPSLSQRYQVKEHFFSDPTHAEKIYFYCNDIWYRYIRESKKSNFRFQSVDYSKIEEAHSPNDVVWKELSLPTETAACTSSTLGENMHFIRLPRRLLQCHVDCPHCKSGNQRSSCGSTPSYYDDSDSDEYSASSEMCDSDDSYYYSSD